MKAKQRGRLVTAQDVDLIAGAERGLKLAVTSLRAAGANNAADYVARARKSVQGALNNARAHLARQERGGVVGRRLPRLTFSYVGVDQWSFRARRWLKTYKLAGEPGSHFKEAAYRIAKERGAVAVFVE